MIARPSAARFKPWRVGARAGLPRAAPMVSARKFSTIRSLLASRDRASAQPLHIKRLQLSDMLWVGRRQCGGTLGKRRIDPHGVDLLLHRLRLGTDQIQLSVPAPR